MESSDRISPLMLLATSIASLLFPEAVGPVRTTTSSTSALVGFVMFGEVLLAWVRIHTDRT